MVPMRPLTDAQFYQSANAIAGLLALIGNLNYGRAADDAKYDNLVLTGFEEFYPAFVRMGMSVDRADHARCALAAAEYAALILKRYLDDHLADHPVTTGKLPDR